MTTDSKIVTLPGATRPPRVENPPCLPAGVPQQLEAVRETMFNAQAILNLIALAGEAIIGRPQTDEAETARDLEEVRRATRLAVEMLDGAAEQLEILGARPAPQEA